MPANPSSLTAPAGAVITDRHMADAFRGHLARAGVERSELFERTKQRRPIRVHDLRATFVTLSLAAGRSEAWVGVMINRYRRAARTAAELGLGALAPFDWALPEIAGPAVHAIAVGLCALDATTAAPYTIAARSEPAAGGTRGGTEIIRPLGGTGIRRGFQNPRLERVSGFESRRGHEVHAGEVIDAAEFSRIKRRMALHHCKWDAQVGDTSALAPFPLIVDEEDWRFLKKAAEDLDREMRSAETLVLADPRARRELGVPRPIERLLDALAVDPSPTLGRIARFDFHPTADGWQVSEVNSDVPGGFTESSSFTRLMGEQVSSKPLCDPTERWLDLISLRAQRVALLVAPGWLEDMQVVELLARGLRVRGVDAVLATPNRLRWSRGVAIVDEPVDAVVRFFQIEWLAKLPKSLGWDRFFTGGYTQLANPGIAVVSESKRFRIACELVGAPMPTWRDLVPKARTVSHAMKANADEWVFKRAFSNTGDSIYFGSELSSASWAKFRVLAGLERRSWVAQRRFRSTPIPTPHGPRHICVGVFTIDGVASGAYARLSRRPKIDWSAVDVAVLSAGEA